MSAEAAVEPVAEALDRCRSTLGAWSEHEHQHRDCVRAAAGDASHLTSAQGIWRLLHGYEEADQRVALVALLRGDSGLDFKSTIYARQVAQATPQVPATLAAFIDLVHRFVSGDEQARGAHDL